LHYYGTRNNDVTLAYALYKKIRGHLTHKTKAFFDDAYKYFKNDGKKLARSALIQQREFKGQHVTAINAYLKNDKNYLKARKILKNKKIPFIHANISELPKRVKQKVDFINLSNIPNWIIKNDLKIGNERIDNFYNQQLLPLHKLLKPKGIIFFYLYTTKMYYQKDYKKPKHKNNPPLLNHPKIRKQLLNKKEFTSKIIRFKGLCPGDDKIVCLQER